MIEFVDRTGNVICRTGYPTYYLWERLARVGFEVSLQDLAVPKPRRGQPWERIYWSAKALTANGEEVDLDGHFPISELYKHRKRFLSVWRSGPKRFVAYLSDPRDLEFW
jgi:hypothetical protein